MLQRRGRYDAIVANCGVRFRQRGGLSPDPTMSDAELAVSILRKLLTEWEPGNPYQELDGRNLTIDGWVTLTDEELAFVQSLVQVTQP